MNVAHIDFNLEEQELCDSILKTFEQHIHNIGRLSVRDNVWVASSVTSSIVFLPTNCPVHGISSTQGAEWNFIDVNQFGKIARITYSTADDNGIFIVVCTAIMYHMVLDMVGAAGWEKDHTTVTICKTPICKDHQMAVRSLLVSVWKKPINPLDIPRPLQDTFLDTIEEHEWTMQENGEPLRGNTSLSLKLKWAMFLLL